MKTNPIVPELYVSSFERSLAFYRDRLGFEILYMRAEERFAFLEREGAQLMIEQSTDPERTWVVGELAQPYGRGLNLQIRVSDVDALHAKLAAARVPFLVAMEEKWYRREDELLGNRQFVIQDPDGYLLRFYGDLGTRPVMTA
jgi:catechol 2,3-dioxygenase-like lactoylglutathione lyase family enzyme